MPVSIALLSISNAREVLQAGLDAIRNGEREFDLGSISVTDSSSIAVMLAWQRAAYASSGSLRFLNTPQNILSLAALYGVTSLLGLPDPQSPPGEETAH